MVGLSSIGLVLLAKVTSFHTVRISRGVGGGNVDWTFGTFFKVWQVI